MQSTEVYSHIIAIELIASMMGVALAVFQIHLVKKNNTNFLSAPIISLIFSESTI